MTLAAELAAVALLAGVAVFAVTGAPDLGAGLWDLLARGRLAGRERASINRSLGPVWEANHVWLVFTVVVMFVAFPKAFHPFVVSHFWALIVLSVGILGRGSAFAFRAAGGDAKLWGLIHGASATITILVLGMALGSVATDAVRVSGGSVTSGLLAGWTTPFALAMGITTVLFAAEAAAINLAADEHEDQQVRESFRRKAIWAGWIALPAGIITIVLSFIYAPDWAAGLLTPEALGTLVGASILGAGTLFLISQRRWRGARWTAIGQGLLLVITWGLAQRPRILGPDLTISNSASPDTMLWYVLGFCVLGSLVLIPSLVFMFRVFKTAPKTKSS